MQKFWTKILLLAVLLMTSVVFAQSPHHDGGMHHLWPDSLTTTEVTGTVTIDSTFFHLVYFLDEDGDGNADYRLSFGPWWYEPESGATRPSTGQTVTIVGVIQDQGTPPNLIVFEINGLTWRQAVAYGMHGWNGDPFWNDLSDTLTITGRVMVDTTYFYDYYFLDTNTDSIPEYKLGFGPPWYEPESGATRPEDGETVTIFGAVQEMPGVDMLSVYAINSLQWRPFGQPAPWAGIWMHRGHSDTVFVYCVTDSANWVGFPPGHMGGGMGGMMWPESSFVQFWEIHPDSLPGNHDDENFRGFYLNVHDPSGADMMDGRFGGPHGMMHFQKEHEFRFHYDDEDLLANGLSEAGIMIKYWDDDAQQWRAISETTVDLQANIVTFSTGDLSNYYALAAPTAITGIGDASDGAIPSEFVLRQNYPNPFNPSTTIHFELPRQADVQLVVYNLIGQQIAVLVNEERAAGVYTVQWHGQDDAGRAVSSGIYLVALKTGSQLKIRRMTLLK
ncbi:MAG: FlgD immunoglobulin-like domain containing protein, partial [bacterium]